VAAVPEIEELNIGHSIVSRAIFIGMEAAVREMQAAMAEGRQLEDSTGTADDR
jgi:pyridoxine 5-phosphate synthase